MKLISGVMLGIALLVLVVLAGQVQAAPLSTQIVGYGQGCDANHTCSYNLTCRNTQAGVSICLPLRDPGQICGRGGNSCPLGTVCDYRQGYAQGVEPYGICKPKGFCGNSGDCQRGYYCPVDRCVPLQQFPRYYTDSCLGDHAGWRPCQKQK